MMKYLSMIEHDASFHTCGFRALYDQVHGKCAKVPRLMQVNIDWFVVLFSEAEDRINAAFRIPVNVGRINAANQIAPIESASDISSYVPGRTSRPLCGKATSSICIQLSSV